MTTHVPMARVPFAPLDNPRLQHLANAKNRQNGMHMQKSPLNEKASINTKSVLSPKRPFDATELDVFDSENIDPAVFDSPSKKSKSDAFDQPVKPFVFSPSAISKSLMPPPKNGPARITTPVRASESSIARTPLTAPAGRSPKRKSAGVFKNRRVSAPFTRIDPPFASRSSGSTLPFSLDAALSGTFSSTSASTAAIAPACKSAGATIRESMPKSWFFDIYEDTPEEEAANLMEHSTLTLDLSSDDESSKKERDSRGKENTPPEDYDGPTASRAVTDPAIAPKEMKPIDIVRKKILVHDEMDDGLRSPLSDLDTDPFIPVGLDKASHVIVEPTPAKGPTDTTKFNVRDLFATPVPFTAGDIQPPPPSTPELCDLPVVNGDEDVKGEIIVWEDKESVEA